MILDQIVERTRARLAAESVELEELRRAAQETSAQRRHHAFAKAIGGREISIIAEIKAASPSAGSIVENPDAARIAVEYARGGAAAISIVTEPDFFRGSSRWIANARAASGLPVIMKDFVVDPAQILAGVAAGADAILLIAAILDAHTLHRFREQIERYGCDALIEVHDLQELESAIEAGARMIGVNNRDLRTFQVDLATSERLVRRIPERVIKVAESGIGKYEDIQRLRGAGFDAFLVGESLLRQNDRAAAVRRLRGEPE
jgi:indole-3-glycerol phosphate synthase